MVTKSGWIVITLFDYKSYHSWLRQDVGKE